MFNYDNKLKKSIIMINNENKKYKIENSKLIELNNFLNLKIQMMINSQENISNNKSFELMKKENHNNNFTENIVFNKTNWIKTLNNFNIQKILESNDNYFNNSNSFDNISLMNKKIDNLNKKNKEIFNIIYKNSESCKNNE